MRELTGLNANSVKKQVFGTGRAWFNIDETILATPTQADPIGAATAAAIAIGATRGGFDFSLVPQYESVEMDGMREGTKNSKRLIYYMAKMGFSAGETSVANLEKFLDRSKKNVLAAPNALTVIEEDLSTTGCTWPAYLTNIALEVAYGDCDNTKAAVFVLRNVVNEAGVSITFEDKKVNVSKVEFTGNYDPAAPTKGCWAIYVPPFTA